MLITAMAVVAALVAGLAWLWRRQEGRWKLPPGPKGLPILGNLLDLMAATWAGETPFATMMRWAQEYGRDGLLYLNFAGQRVVVLYDARLTQHVVTRMADVFGNRPPGLFVSRVLKGKGIVFNEGASWKAHRAFLHHEFRKFSFSGQSIELPIQLSADELIEQLRKVEGKPHDCHLDLATATYNIIWNVISGTKFAWNDPLLSRLIQNLETNLDAMEIAGAHNYVLGLTLFQFLIHNPVKIAKLFLDRMNYFKQLIADREAKTETDADDCMITDYLEKADLKESTNLLNRDQLLYLVSDLFIAGGETTITALRWSIFCLAFYTETQERIRQQLMDQLGPDSTPSYGQRHQIPLLEAFVYEILRYRGVAPGMWRDTTKDCVVGDYEIPRNTWLLMHFAAMGRQEGTWTNSQQFRPERFLDQDGKFVKNENFAAFSMGRRNCPGESLAKTEMYIILANILQRFRITLAEDLTAFPEGIFGITCKPPEFRVVFTSIVS